MVDKILRYKKQRFCLGLIVWGLPFSIFLGNSMMILGLLGIVFLGRNKGVLKKPISHIKIWGFPMLFFGLVFISAFLGVNTKNGLVQVEKHLLLLVFSAVFMLTTRLSKRAYVGILKGFVYSNLLLCLILILNATIRYFLLGDDKVFFFHEFGSLFDLHPIYIGINFAISVFIIQQLFKVKKGVKNKTKQFFLAQALLLIGLLLCASKAVLIIFFILLLIDLIFKLISSGKTFVFSALLAGILIGGFFIPQIRERFIEGLALERLEFSPTNSIDEAKKFTPEDKRKLSDIEFRSIITKIGLYHLYADGRVFFGYGISDSQAVLDYYYMYYGLAPGWYQGYNLHNQYIQYLFTFGLLGLSILLFYLIFSFRQAILTKNKLHLYFLIMISWVFLFECLLSRNKGLAIVFVLNGIFCLNTKWNENSHSWNPRHPKPSRWI